MPIHHFHLNTKKFHWPGKIDVTAAGAVVGATIPYFSCYVISGQTRGGKEVRGPMLVGTIHRRAGGIGDENGAYIPDGRGHHPCRDGSSDAPRTARRWTPVRSQVPCVDGPSGPIKAASGHGHDPHAGRRVYGSTEATWGASACHLFRTDGAEKEHLLDVTSKLAGQPKVSDMAVGPKGVLVCATTTYNEIFDDSSKKYEGGRLFTFDPATKAFMDYGVIAPGQGINCVAVDTLHTRIYGVTYPAGNLFAYDYAKKTTKDFGEVMAPWPGEGPGTGVVARSAESAHDRR